jgi:hypothetical protein
MGMRREVDAGGFLGLHQSAGVNGHRWHGMGYESIHLTTGSRIDSKRLQRLEREMSVLLLLILPFTCWACERIQMVVWHMEHTKVT